jgi:DNA oxidative demethylase
VLFEPEPQAPVALAPDFWLLRGFTSDAACMPHIDAVAALAPFRQLQVPGGQTMRVAMTNCGSLGWQSNAQGYGYTRTDPLTGQAWPTMPLPLAALAQRAAAAVGWPAFEPDACLVNRYANGAGMGLHQDRDERDHSQPIVSVSLGASCRFVIGGLRRSEPVPSVLLHPGDVLVWGGAAGLRFHGVRPLPADALRYNLTFRKAG